MGSSSPLKMQLQFWNYCQVAMETCILAFSGILAVWIEHFHKGYSHMSPQNVDFRCTPLFHWVSWYCCVGNYMALLLVAKSPRTNGMLWQRSNVKVTQKMDYSKI